MPEACRPRPRPPPLPPPPTHTHSNSRPGSSGLATPRKQQQQHQQQQRKGPAPRTACAQRRANRVFGGERAGRRRRPLVPPVGPVPRHLSLVPALSRAAQVAHRGRPASGARLHVGGARGGEGQLPPRLLLPMWPCAGRLCVQQVLLAQVVAARGGPSSEAGCPWICLLAWGLRWQGEGVGACVLHFAGEGGGGSRAANTRARRSSWQWRAAGRAPRAGEL